MATKGRNILKHFFLITFTVLTLFLAGNINTNTPKPLTKITKQQTALNFDNKLMSAISMGNEKMMADLIWITTLLESDHKHYKARDLNSWMYHRFKTITDLDPKFLNAYDFGGKYLAIIKDDTTGAEKLYSRGLKYYPENYDLNFNLGYLYAYELDNFQKAKYLFKKIQNDIRAPKFIKSLIVKIDYQTHKDPAITLQLVLKLLEGRNDPMLRDKLLGDAYKLKAQIDLDCLNNNKQNCERKDFKGNPYFLKNGLYRALDDSTYIFYK